MTYALRALCLYPAFTIPANDWLCSDPAERDRMGLQTGVLPQRNCDRITRPSLRPGTVYRKNDRDLHDFPARDQPRTFAVVDGMPDESIFISYINIFRCLDMFLALRVSRAWFEALP
ncbi:hypothetical protein [Synoicihabitans lomoniglobus]|uniref:hypothetical protein n=1 Tax=Synoicihabitans lomoniglobus TaxID=2909285 RepID=UPI003CE4DC1A